VAEIRYKGRENIDHSCLMTIEWGVRLGKIKDMQPYDFDIATNDLFGKLTRVCWKKKKKKYVNYFGTNILPTATRKREIFVGAHVQDS
jgi:hypothetical protein